MEYFKNGEFQINNTEDVYSVLIKISNSLFKLSDSQVFNNRLVIGGVYHKNYYNLICSGFYNKENIVFTACNTLISEFLYNLKHNLCNYGIYFLEKNNKLYLKIYSGNTFLLDVNQINYVEKTIKNNNIFTSEIIKFKSLENLYQKNFISKIKQFNFCIKCENKHLNKQIKKFNLSKIISENEIFIAKDLSYEIYINKCKLSLNKVFKYFKRYDIIEDELIKKINLENIKKVINSKFLIYNKLSNNFDIFLTLKYISWRLANDKDYTKLV